MKNEKSYMSWNNSENNKKGSPPDMDEIIYKIKSNIIGFFKKRNASNGQDGNNRFFSKKTIKAFLSLIILASVTFYGVIGLYSVGPGEQALITRFGKFHSITNPGLHWLPYLIDSRHIVNVQQVSTTEHSGKMLTEDENIVEVQVKVQYRVNNIKDFIFNVQNPVLSLKEATESALRQVIGFSTLDHALTTGRAAVVADITKQIEIILKKYKAGLEIFDVTLQYARAPEEVRDAFEDAIKAREDYERFKHKAEAYANQIVPKAKGQAERLIQEANAYKKEIIFKAKGDTARFNQILPEYEQAENVTKTRLYIDTLENILRNSSKILLDEKNGNYSNNIIYLPIDKLISNRNTYRKNSMNVDLSHENVRPYANSNMNNYDRYYKYSNRNRN